MNNSAWEETQKYFYFQKAKHHGVDLLQDLYEAKIEVGEVKGRELRFLDFFIQM